MDIEKAREEARQKPIADLVQRVEILEAQNLERQTEEAKQRIIDIQAQAFGSANSYTTVVVFGAYAALFTIWNFVRGDITTTFAAIAGIGLGISVTVFVIYQIFQMYTLSNQFMSVVSLSNRNLTPGEFLAEYQALASKNNEASNKRLIPIWRLTLVVTVLSGLAAAVTLMIALARNVNPFG